MAKRKTKALTLAQVQERLWLAIILDVEAESGYMDNVKDALEEPRMRAAVKRAAKSLSKTDLVIPCTMVDLAKIKNEARKSCLSKEAKAAIAAASPEQDE